MAHPDFAKLTEADILAMLARANTNTITGGAPPANADPGSLWFDESTARLYTYYDDGDSVQWVSAGIGFSGLSIEEIQGYYSILTGFYFDGAATETEINEDNVGTWVDVLVAPDPDGVFDYRPSPMKQASPLAITGDGSDGSPIVFSLEGLSLRSAANFRSSLSFEPDVDESVLETRLLFNRHSGTTPSQDFSIEEVTLNMTQGADIEYSAEPMLSFFVGDTIDTNGAGDAGQCRFQVKSSVEGTLRVRALTWYIQQ